MGDDLGSATLSRRRFLGYAAAAGVVSAASALPASGWSAKKRESEKSLQGLRRGGVLRASVGAEFRGFDAARFWDPNNFVTADLLFSRLVRQNPLDARQILGDLAGSLPRPTNGGRTYTFVLRGARFHDGRPVTAADVKYSIERLLHPKTKSEGGSLYAGIIEDTDGIVDGRKTTSRGIVVVNDRTVRFELVEPRADFLPLLSLPFASIVPRHVVTRVSEESFNFSPIGSGPFRIQSHRSGRRTVFSRFRDYFAPNAVFLEGIVIDAPVDPETAVLRIDRGQLDLMLDEVPSGSYNAIRSDPQRRRRLLEKVTDNIRYLTLNSYETSPIFRSESVRRAIGLAINRGRLVRQLQGRGRPASAFWSPASQYYDGGFRGLEYDPDAAKRLVAEAGLGDVSFDFLVPLDRWSAQIAPSIVQDLQAAGLNVNLKTSEFSNWLGHTMDPDVMVPNSWPMSVPHGSYVVNSAFTSSTKEAAESSGACCNFSRFATPEVDRLARVGVQTTNKNQEVRAYQRIMKIVVERALWIPLYWPTRTLYRSPNVRNLVVPANWEGLFLSRVALAG